MLTRGTAIKNNASRRKETEAEDSNPCCDKKIKLLLINMLRYTFDNDEIRSERNMFHTLLPISYYIMLSPKGGIKTMDDCGRKASTTLSLYEIITYPPPPINFCNTLLHIVAHISLLSVSISYY